jgi:hypothetical protein
VLDKLNKAVDRQEAKLQIESLEADLLRMETNHGKLVADYNAMDERAQQLFEARGKKGPYKPSAQELMQKGNTLETIKAGKANIDRLKADINKARSVIADVD